MLDSPEREHSVVRAFWYGFFAFGITFVAVQENLIRPDGASPLIESLIAGGVVGGLFFIVVGYRELRIDWDWWRSGRRQRRLNATAPAPAAPPDASESAPAPPPGA